MEAREASTETLVASPNTLVVISGLVFTSAGVVTSEAAAGKGSSSTMSGSRSTKIMSTAMGSAASASTTHSGGVKWDLWHWGTRGIAAVTGVLYYLV